MKRIAICTLALDGDVSEVIGCKGAISAQHLAAVDAYLKGKYGL